MAAVLTVRFTPDSLSAYQDSLTILAESGPLPVALVAQRLRPSLTLPDTLDVGMCLIGDYIHTRSASQPAPCLPACLPHVSHPWPPQSSPPLD